MQYLSLHVLLSCCRPPLNRLANTAFVPHYRLKGLQEAMLDVCGSVTMCPAFVALTPLEIRNYIEVVSLQSIRG